MANNWSGKYDTIPYNLPLSWGIVFTAFVTLIAQLPCETESTFTPYFVWSAVNKTLDEDRLTIVDGNNEKVKVKWCTKVVLFNQGSEHFVRNNNYSGEAILIDTSLPTFATDKVMSNLKERMQEMNLGVCIPCIVVISIVNVTTTPEEKSYLKSNADNQLDSEYWRGEENKLQDYKLALSQEFTKLLQFKTPIQARHLVLVRLVEKKEELTKCHGKKYTKYPRRLVPIWEQVLFDHFKEARVLQGATAEGYSETTLLSGKESGIWVWMCEEIIRRLELYDMCQEGTMEQNKCQVMEASGNLSTAAVDMANVEECRTYRARS